MWQLQFCQGQENTVKAEALFPATETRWRHRHMTRLLGLPQDFTGKTLLGSCPMGPSRVLSTWLPPTYGDGWRLLCGTERKMWLEGGTLIACSWRYQVAALVGRWVDHQYLVKHKYPSAAALPRAHAGVHEMLGHLPSETHTEPSSVSKETVHHTEALPQRAARTKQNCFFLISESRAETSISRRCSLKAGSLSEPIFTTTDNTSLINFCYKEQNTLAHPVTVLLGEQAVQGLLHVCFKEFFHLKTKSPPP